ncbi:MAG: osmotically inducible protein OsmC [Firmicutes bacterium HGW-Firmicutes-20]|jgi:putative redox protein|nr:MAG: osmotically inducible protein OsmC [Firmicutes bacterium HGW-Firmicutes-20]PKM66739.1 MAG: osmotically inducible protein OsmC [Firmicutes bacterium HGW-Firmicutes-19]
MGQHVEADVRFSDVFDGELMLKEGSIGIGMKPDQAGPYKLLLAALTGCFHSTFLDVAVKKRLTFKSVSYRLEGEKRDEVPQTLSVLHITIKVEGADNQTQIHRCFELAEKYCSIYTTLSKVAQLSYEVSFI